MEEDDDGEGEDGWIRPHPPISLKLPAAPLSLSQPPPNFVQQRAQLKDMDAEQSFFSSIHPSELAQCWKRCYK